MKKLILSLTVLAASLTAVAQQFVIVDGQVKEYPFLQGQQVFLADEIESISYRIDPDFRLMPELIVGDQNLKLFGQALQLTGLTDSLTAYYDYDYNGEAYAHLDGLYHSDNHYQYVKMLRHRYIQFTAFVETDDVFAAHGIMTLEDLKTYAKKVYDEVYPEDAGITDPTDRRNSLNRFVAYHFLPMGMTRETLTAYPGFFNQTLGDPADWYRTLMPHASLKVSRPRTDSNPNTEIGLFLNRRGIMDGPDKYGVQTKGIQIGESVMTNNGQYFYIDDLLTYDKKTQTETLQERWRVDFVTLSPDFMTSQTRTMKATYADPTNSSQNAAIGYLNQYTNDITWNEDADLFIGPARFYFWDYGGDEVTLRSDNNTCDLSVNFPPLPEGDWELRLGTCMISSRPSVMRICLDDNLLCDTVDFSVSYDSRGRFDFSDFGYQSSYNIDAEVLQYRAEIDDLLLTLPKRAHYTYGVREVSGELVYSDGTPIPERLTDIVNRPYISAADLDLLQSDLLPQHKDFFMRELFRLNGWLPGPADYRWLHTIASGQGQYYWTSSNSDPYSSIPNLSRCIIGRFHTDGKTDHKLRISALYSPSSAEFDFDYLEFCPVSIADHPTIPED